MKFAEAEHIVELYDTESDKKWHDGVVYRTIRLEYVR
jgi:hypothetical protein